MRLREVGVEQGEQRCPDPPVASGHLGNPLHLGFLTLLDRFRDAFRSVLELASQIARASGQTERYEASE